MDGMFSVYICIPGRLYLLLTPLHHTALLMLSWIRAHIENLEGETQSLLICVTDCAKGAWRLEGKAFFWVTEDCRIESQSSPVLKGHLDAGPGPENKTGGFHLEGNSA